MATSMTQRVDEALKSPYMRAVLDMIAASEIGRDGDNGKKVILVSQGIAAYGRSNDRGDS